MSLGLCCFIAVLAAGHAKAEEVEWKVMTFNIRYDNPNDGLDAWPRRKEFVAEVIKSEQPGLAGLQEVLAHQAEFLQESLAEYEVIGVGRDDGQSQGEQVPILIHRERYEVVTSGHFWLSKTPEVPGSRDWDAAITRMVTWARVVHKETGTTLLFANTHFDHRGAEARLESAKLIRRQLHEVAGGAPIVLTGDFNCLPQSDPYTAITSADEEGTRMFDTLGICESDPQGPNSTWNGFREIIPNRRIDFVFVGEGIEVASHRTLDTTREGRFPSDHLPVSTLLRWNR